MGKGKALHGNNAKVDPQKKVVGRFVTNTVTMSDRKDHETPIVDEDDVEYAKKFVEENKK